MRRLVGVWTWLILWAGLSCSSGERASEVSPSFDEEQDRGGAPDTTFHEAVVDVAEADAPAPEAIDEGPPEAGSDAAADTPSDAATRDTREDAALPDAPPSPEITPETSLDLAPQDSADDPELPPAASLPLPAEVSCAAGGDACAAGVTQPGLAASYRKDVYLNDAEYNEYTDSPLEGGRFHLAGLAAAGGDVTTVFLNGADATTLLKEPTLEWFHVWPRKPVAGQPIWVAFHSRDDAWDDADDGQIRVETTEGVALEGSFPVAITDVPLTYVTTTDDLSTLLVHAKNRANAPRTLQALYVNGREVLQAGVACVPQPTLAPGEAVLWTVPLCTPAVAGDAWTVVATFADTSDSVGVGRILRPHFPIEGWSNDGECPYPGVNDTAYQAMRDAHFDTMFLRWSSDCGGGADVATQTLPPLGDYFALLDEGVLEGNLEDKGLVTAAIAGILTGDESDGEIYAEDGTPNAWRKAQRAAKVWQATPDVTVYNGAKTNGHVGSFAGMSDVQGMDLYAAACAPHITSWGKHPPLRGPFDYLRNARDNHMPLPTWLYAQGLSPVWNKKALIGGDVIHIQPDPQEILAQAFMVAAAGGKGLMWFQVNQDEAAHKPARWEAIRQANQVFRALRDLLREGDPIGTASVATNLPSSDPDQADPALVEVIRAPDALVVIVVALAASAKPTDLSCGGALLSESMAPHWVLKSQLLSLDVRVPTDLAAVDAFEVRPGQVVDAGAGLSVEGRHVTFTGVPVDNTTPYRVLVLGATPEVRVRVLAATL